MGKFKTAEELEVPAQSKVPFTKQTMKLPID